MPHFFIKTSDVNNNIITISDKENYKHIKQSLRAKINEPLLLVDENQIQYETRIAEITNTCIKTCISKKYPSNRYLKCKIHLAQSVLRSDAQNFVIQKATELGVCEIIPVITDNCAVKKSVAQGKIEHFKKIAYEAAKQCERPNIPIINGVFDFNKIININDYNHIIAFVERTSDLSLKKVFADCKIKENANILVIIGPEGGFSENEFEMLKSNKDIKKVTLGNLILKAETAVIAGLSNIIHELSE